MRKIIHIDMDCFYAAVEMRDNPSLKNIPMAVGGSVDKRGVISTANYPARQFGVHSAMPVGQALKLCPHLKMVPSRMPLYKEISKKIHAIFQRYTAIIEPLSLDEAYLDVSDCQLLRGSATLIAKDIRQAIFNELQLTASAGIAPIKFLAKIASDINKPNGQYVIRPEEIDSFLTTLPLKKIPGVGRVTEQKLAELGLFTCQDIQRFDLAELLKKFGKLGSVLHNRCHGIDQREVCHDRQRKSIGVETTVNEDIHQWSDCFLIIDKLYVQLEARLRQVKPDLRIARQGVKYKFNDFRLTTQEHVWQNLNKEDLVEIAQQMWLERRQERGVRLIGLHVTLNDPQVEKQLPLLF